MTTPRATAAIHPFFDPATSTWTYLLHAPASDRAAIIDPVLDYDPRSGRIATGSAERLLDASAKLGLQIDWILETHAHADHLSAASWLKRELGGRPRIGIGRGITQVQESFRELLALGAAFRCDGSQFDRLFDDGDRLEVGDLSIEIIASPGHTPDSVSYLVGDAVFIGDTLFMPDYGSARCDFPGGNAAQLFASVRRLLSLPGEPRLFLCHDYPLTQREPACESSTSAQRTGNVHVHEGIGEAEFVALRTARDATLASPLLLWPSIQVNIRAGNLPDADAAGRRYLRVPLRGSLF